MKRKLIKIILTIMILSLGIWMFDLFKDGSQITFSNQVRLLDSPEFKFKNPNPKNVIVKVSLLEKPFFVSNIVVRFIDPNNGNIVNTLRPKIHTNFIAPTVFVSEIGTFVEVSSNDSEHRSLYVIDKSTMRKIIDLDGLGVIKMFVREGKLSVIIANNPLSDKFDYYILEIDMLSGNQKKLHLPIFDLIHDATYDSNTDSLILKTDIGLAYVNIEKEMIQKQIKNISGSYHLQLYDGVIYMSDSDTLVKIIDDKLVNVYKFSSKIVNFMVKDNLVYVDDSSTVMSILDLKTNKIIYEEDSTGFSEGITSINDYIIFHKDYSLVKFQNKNFLKIYSLKDNVIFNGLSYNRIY